MLTFISPDMFTTKIYHMINLLMMLFGVMNVSVFLV